ncbi:subtilisin-like protease [Elsinoe ampelina]|uniref:Subtilisin-like protease n=1 Tax=Elsinoe ampelina TaxID=302913 RepID=A0A6A6GRE2_9PEZI|nr:subtilisin-like protease [Elsinoe ampelina]
MFVSPFFTWAALLLPATVSALEEQKQQTVPGLYIAEFHDEHESITFWDDLHSKGHAVEPRMELSYQLFKGASFHLKPGQDTEAAVRNIEAFPMVKRLWPVRQYTPVGRNSRRTRKNAHQAGPGLLKRQDMIGNASYAPHVMTQVDQLHSRGIRGEGIKIAVVDTGIDYMHEALGGCFGTEDCLVSFGYDLVGDNYTGYTTPVPDNDPRDTCEGHGTHVAGIIAAQNTRYGFTGAAPGVKLGAYRVFGCSGFVTDDVLIAAFNRAYQDGADIITASIGLDNGWSDNPTSVAISRIVAAGIPCTVAAGNSGVSGQFFTSSSGDGRLVSAIASFDNTDMPSLYIPGSYTVQNQTISFGWTYASGFDQDVVLPLWSVNYDTKDPANACDGLPDDTPDLSRYIVLIRRGTCAFSDKLEAVQAKGARYVMFYNNVGGTATVSAELDGILGIGMVNATVGREWISLLSNGAEISIQILHSATTAEPTLEIVPNDQTGGLVSTFTSWGPTFELDVKPQFAAPGGNILSTYPLALGGYAVESGTSMATPLAAAIYALVAQVRGTHDPTILRDVLSSTAKPQLYNIGPDNATFPYLAPVQQQGAGLLQAFDAAYATVLLDRSSLAFNDSTNFAGVQNFSVHNTGNGPVVLRFKHVPAGTFYSLTAGDNVAEAFPNTYNPAVAEIHFSEQEITVSAGDSAVVTVDATPPTGLDGLRLPVYSGYIAINGSDGSALSLPYLGVAGAMRDVAILDKNQTYLTALSDLADEPVPAGKHFIIPPSNSTNNSTASNGTVYDAPQIIAAIKVATALLRIDVYPGSTNDTSLAGAIGSISGAPLEYLLGVYASFIWTGLFANGTVAPAGEYKIVIRALHLLGDASKESDYDKVETASFSIEYGK